MSLSQGGVTLRRFLALGPVPDEEALCKGLNADRFRPFKGGSEEEKFGWVDWRNLLDSPPDPNWVMQDRYAVFTLRIDTRKVPPMLLKAQAEKGIERLMEEKDLAFVGREARLSLLDEVRDGLTSKVLPTPRVAEVAWDLREGLVLTTASGPKVEGILTGLFMKSFNVELQPLLLAGRLAPRISVQALGNLEPFSLCTEDE